jgi:hypothetical protein
MFWEYLSGFIPVSASLEILMASQLGRIIGGGGVVDARTRRPLLKMRDPCTCIER